MFARQLIEVPVWTRSFNQRQRRFVIQAWGIAPGIQTVAGKALKARFNPQPQIIPTYAVHRIRAHASAITLDILPEMFACDDVVLARARIPER